MTARGDTVSGGRRSADELAKCILMGCIDSGSAITSKHITNVLNMWRFRKNVDRKNVMPEGNSFVLSDSIGLDISRCGVRCVLQGIEEDLNSALLLNVWLQAAVPVERTSCEDGVPCTTICINARYAARRHRDRNNRWALMVQQLWICMVAC